MSDTRSSATERLVNALNELFGRALALDPDLSRKLRSLEGRSLGVTMEGPGLSLTIAVEDRILTAKPGLAADVSASVRASPGAFLALAASGGASAVGRISIDGDSETARRFQAFFRELEPDWEEALTRLLGDVAGFQASRLLRQGAQWLRFAGETLADQTSEYVREESRQLVTGPEMESFLDAVDDLRDDAERLLQRADRLLDRR